jgi:predicted phosphoribosyltransferase/pimeloyl-ACP methyl ester carboxylesterase
MRPNVEREPWTETVRVPAGAGFLIGELELPAGAKGVVLFAHGSGSGRRSPRNRFVAQRLRAAGLGTLLLDLLTQDEEAEDAVRGHLRFNVRMLAERLAAATAALADNPATAHLPVAFFGASTGAATALIAAARLGQRIAAIVSRGGRPDLAGLALGRVLLLVGGLDGPVIGLNQEAQRHLGATVKELVIVPGASHLFEEPGKLDEVAQLAANWFTRFFDAAEQADDEIAPILYKNRREAGKHLAQALKGYAGQTDLLVLALPRGGVPIGYEVAMALQAPLDVIVVRKLGLPGQQELAMGAIASGGVRVINDEVVRALDIQPETIEDVAEREWPELRRREMTYRGERTALEVEGKTILLVDDGLATGSTMRAAVTALRQRNPRRIVVAVPVGPQDVCASMEDEADEVVCLRRPQQFGAVGRWYEDFGQTTDDQVRELLGRVAGAAKPQAATWGDMG